MVAVVLKNSKNPSPVKESPGLGGWPGEFDPKSEAEIYLETNSHIFSGQQAPAGTVYAALHSLSAPWTLPTAIDSAIFWHTLTPFAASEVGRGRPYLAEWL
jgi:hypothetical protein